jgi:4-nitrophenyl phosphatase
VSWVLDLDGVVWLGDAPIPGASEAIARLQADDGPVVFVTNNSFARRADVAAKLASHGIDAGDGVITSATAAAGLIERGQRVLVCGGPGVFEAVDDAGATATDDDTNVDVVVVGYHPTFDYDGMRRAATAVLAGARLVATNDDATYPTPDGPIPGAGSILASIVTATGAEPTIAGKPYRPMADLVLAHVGTEGWVVGDRPDTDGRLAKAMGFRYGLVLTGVTRAGDLPVEPTPDAVSTDLQALVASQLGPGR